MAISNQKNFYSGKNYNVSLLTFGKNNSYRFINFLFNFSISLKINDVIEKYSVDIVLDNGVLKYKNASDNKILDILGLSNTFYLNNGSSTRITSSDLNKIDSFDGYYTLVLRVPNLKIENDSVCYIFYQIDFDESLYNGFGTEFSIPPQNYTYYNITPQNIFIPLNEFLHDINYQDLYEKLLMQYETLENSYNELEKSSKYNDELLNKTEIELFEAKEKLNEYDLTIKNKDSVIDLLKIEVVNIQSEVLLANDEMIKLNNELKSKESSIIDLTWYKDEYSKILNKLYNSEAYINELTNSVESLLNGNDFSTEKIYVDIFRISADGKYLEIDISCNELYEFKSFIIKDFNYDDTNNSSLIWDFTSALTPGATRQLLRINLDLLNGSSMYYAEIEVLLMRGVDTEGEDAKDVVNSNLNATTVASDVSNVYFYLLNNLIRLAHPCDPCDLEIPIELLRAFIILQAHVEAMRLERYDEAEMFYRVIKNNFLHCLSLFEVKYNSCNCHGKLR